MDETILQKRDCHDCGAKPGSLHQGGCDTEQCPKCGGQFISCGCRTTRARLPWTGIWPGTLECIEYGWFTKWVPDSPPKYAPGAWVTCDQSDPDAGPALNRLRISCDWDPKKKRFVKRS